MIAKFEVQSLAPMLFEVRYSPEAQIHTFHTYVITSGTWRVDGFNRLFNNTPSLGGCTVGATTRI